MTFPQLLDSQSNKETRINEANLALISAGLFGKDPTSSGLTYKTLGGNDIFVSLYDVVWNTAVPADTSVTLSAAATHYFVANRSTSAITMSTTNTNWLDTTNYARIRIVTTVGSVITSDQDYRAAQYGTNASSSGGGGGGTFITLTDAPASYSGQKGKYVNVNPAETAVEFVGGAQNAQSGTSYTLVIGDREKTVTMNNAAANALTVPPNSSVAYPIGTLIGLKQLGAGATAIAAGVGVTIRNNGLTFARQYGSGVLEKIGTDEWVLTGEFIGTGSIVVDRAYAEYTTNASLGPVIPFDNSIPQIGEGAQILSVAIPPKSTTNRIRVRVQFFFSNSAGAEIGVGAVFLNGATNAVAASAGAMFAANVPGVVVIEYEYVPGTTATQTFTVRAAGGGVNAIGINGSNAARFLGGVARATIVVEELSA